MVRSNWLVQTKRPEGLLVAGVCWWQKANTTRAHSMRKAEVRRRSREQPAAWRAQRAEGSSGRRCVAALESVGGLRGSKEGDGGERGGRKRKRKYNATQEGAYCFEKEARPPSAAHPVARQGGALDEGGTVKGGTVAASGLCLWFVYVYTQGVASLHSQTGPGGVPVGGNCGREGIVGIRDGF